MQGDFPFCMSWWDTVRERLKGGGDGGGLRTSVNQLRGLLGWGSAAEVHV